MDPNLQTVITLENLLVRRGLRFPIWSRSKRLLTSRYGITWVFAAEVLTNVLLWSVLLSRSGMTSHEKWSSTLIISILQTLPLAFFLAIGVLAENSRYKSLLHKSSELPRPIIMVFVVLVLMVTMALEIVSLGTGIILVRQLVHQDFFSIFLNIPFFAIIHNYAVVFLISLFVSLGLFLLSFLTTTRNLMQRDTTRKLFAAIAAVSLMLSQASVFMLLAIVISGRGFFIGLLLQILALQFLIGPPLNWGFMTILAGASITLSALPSLVKLRANVLGLTFLAATIPFLNADSWQLITGIQWANMLWIIGLIYLLPITILALAQRHNIFQELHLNGWEPNTDLKLETLLATAHSMGVRLNDGSGLPQVVKASESNNRSDILRVYAKAVLKSILLITILPFTVFLFALVLFQSMISQQVLTEWIRGFQSPTSAKLLLFSIDGWNVLKLKAAVLLAILSATSALGTLLTSKSDFLEFMRMAFANEIRKDKHLLVLHRLLIKTLKTTFVGSYLDN